VQVSGRPSGHGPRLVATMISGIFTACAREAVAREELDLDDAAALCESFLYGALRGVDPELIEALS
jgi:hypothetical protein